MFYDDVYGDEEIPYVHFHFIPQYKNELKLFNKVYKIGTLDIIFEDSLLVNLKGKRYFYKKKSKIFKIMKEEFNL